MWLILKETNPKKLSITADYPYFLQGYILKGTCNLPGQITR